MCSFVRYECCSCVTEPNNTLDLLHQAVLTLCCILLHVSLQARHTIDIQHLTFIAWFHFFFSNVTIKVYICVSEVKRGTLTSVFFRTLAKPGPGFRRLLLKTRRHWNLTEKMWRCQGYFPVLGKFSSPVSAREAVAEWIRW